MFYRLKRRSPSVDYLLSTLSPRDVAESAARFVASRAAKVVLEEIRRSADRMAPTERAQFAFELGCDLPASDDFPMVDPAMSTQRLLEVVDRDPALAVERFAPYLEHNPRALRTLDPPSIQTILSPLLAPERTPLASRVPLVASLCAGILAIALIVGFTFWTNQPKTRALPTTIAQNAATARVIPPRVTAQRAIAPRPLARLTHARLRHAPVVSHTPRVKRAHVISKAFAHRRATARVNRPPATAHRAPPAYAYRRIARALPRPRYAAPATEPVLVERARLIVSSYLASIIRGDASSALGNLGLSASAPVSNLTEDAVLAPDANFRIVDSKLRSDLSAKIDVVISSSRGHFFGVYTVQANGPAVWITDHTVIPVGTSVAAHR